MLKSFDVGGPLHLRSHYACEARSARRPRSISSTRSAAALCRTRSVFLQCLHSRSRDAPVSTPGATSPKPRGLKVRPWLSAFKTAILRGDRDDATVEFDYADSSNNKPRTMPLRILKQDIARIASGRKIAYVVDAPDMAQLQDNPPALRMHV
jgi:hypothetical protein